MELETISTTSSEREEGEILDDDLEEISDDSLIVPLKGKLGSYTESLCGLSLSSVSENDELSEPTPEENRKRKRKKKVRKRSYHSEDEITKKLLHDAVKLETPEEVTRKSLRTRLKKMCNPEPITLLTSDILEEQTNSEKTESENKEDDDNELIQLRMEALKTAILNKFQHRKNRDLAKTADINKENSPNENKEIVPEPEVPKDDSEDEDILRAVLLASMSKKITTEENKTTTVNVEKKPLVQTNQFKPLLIPKVKPLIISVNASDSDDEAEPKSDTNGLQLSVEKFLKEQRAKVEAEQEKAPVRKIVPKSVVELLPKSKQLEYQRLLLRLKNAEKPKKPALVKKLKMKNGESNILDQSFRDVQERQNGRLQIKGKYRSLAPIISKINEASVQRQKLEVHVKNLIGQLKEARAQCQHSRQTLEAMMKEFVSKKNQIDKRSNQTKFKLTNNFGASSIQNSESSDKSIIKYISPLNSKSCDINPLQIMCPFEMNGSCRDEECTFNHCVR